MTHWAAFLSRNGRHCHERNHCEDTKYALSETLFCALVLEYPAESEDAVNMHTYVVDSAEFSPGIGFYRTAFTAHQKVD